MWSHETLSQAQTKSAFQIIICSCKTNQKSWGTQWVGRSETIPMVNFWARWNGQWFFSRYHWSQCFFFTSEPSLSIVFHISTIGFDGISNGFLPSKHCHRWFSMVTVYLVFWLWMSGMGWIKGTVNQTTACWTLFKNDRRNSGGMLRQKFNLIDFWHLTFNQWTNGQMEQWTNGPMDQWSNFPIF